MSRDSGDKKNDDTNSGAEFQRLVDKLFWPLDDEGKCEDEESE